MNTTVFNLDTLAVTEYTPALTGLSNTYEATTDGVLKVGGATDEGGAKVAASFTLGLTLSPSGKQRRPKYLYLHGDALKGATADVLDGKGGTYTYTALQRRAGVARFVLGGGIRDNYLDLTVRLSNVLPASVDRLEFETFDSTTRRM
jgi:hypothetical protein